MEPAKPRSCQTEDVPGYSWALITVRALEPSSKRNKATAESASESTRTINANGGLVNDVRPSPDGPSRRILGARCLPASMSEVDPSAPRPSAERDDECSQGG